MNILDQVNNDWWWAECNGNYGYAPSNHLVDTQPNQQWENNEYFDSYSHLVGTSSSGVICGSLQHFAGLNHLIALI